MPTSQPDDLKCILTTDKSLEFSWKLPRKGMTNSVGKVDVNYRFSYWIEEKTGGMYLPHLRNKKFLLKFLSQPNASKFAIFYI